MKKYIKYVFAASLFMNAILLGLIGGHEYQKWQVHPWQDVKQDLAPESRNLVARTFQSAFREIREIGDEARKTRSDLVEILSNPTFDEKAFDKTVKKLTEERQKITALKIQATKTVAQGLNPVDRKNMATRMTDMIGGGERKEVRRDRNPMEIISEEGENTDKSADKKTKKSKKHSKKSDN